MNTATICEIVRATLEERFPDARIDSVDIEDDRDADGEPILNIRVVFEAAGDRLDAREASSFVRYLRNRLAHEDARDMPFPVLSFIAKSDLGRHRPEAA